MALPSANISAATLLPPRDRVEQVSQLALDLTRGLMPAEDAVAKNGFTHNEAEQLLRNPSFQRLMRNVREEWMDSGNARQRAMLKAGVALEDGVEQLYRMMHGDGGGPDGKLSAVQVEAVKALARIAGVGGSGSAGGGGSVGAPMGATPTAVKVIFNFRGKPPETIIDGNAIVTELDDPRELLPNGGTDEDDPEYEEPDDD